MTSRVEIARAYLRAIEGGESTQRFFTDDAIQEEYPNRLNPVGACSNVAQMAARAERGKAMVSWQRYEVVNAFESGAIVVLEVNWSAAYNIAIGSLQPGELMKARFAVFLDFEDERIRRQRNYDCFDPF